MSKMSFVWIGLSCALVAGSAPRAAATPLPADRKVEFAIHKSPTDPSSVVTARITLSLTALRQYTNDIAWGVTLVTVQEYDSNGVWTGEWRGTAPTVGTSGVWLVTHADPTKPELSEFLAPPQISGTAVAKDSSVADLDYYLKAGASTYTSPYSMTASLDHQLWKDGASEPDDDGDDEPVESGDGPTNPT